MAKDKLSDAEAKAILCKWPSRTKKLWRPPENKGFWLAALPKVGKATCPTILSPGAGAFRTQPDGLWAYIRPNKSMFADVVSIEVCGTMQNVNDKRSRYMAASHSLVLLCPLPWLLEETKLPRGGKKPRWEATVVVFVDMDSEDAEWLKAAYEQFLSDDSGEDAIYEKYR
jgi:hypothetical protein